MKLDKLTIIQIRKFRNDLQKNSRGGNYKKGGVPQRKAAHLKIRKDFDHQYCPEFNEKPKAVAQAVKPKTAMELCLEEVQAYLDSRK